MRLTLRTLLAYLDDILEPQDSEDLRKKIDDSKFATELVQRTRDCVRRLRLPAPPLSGRGLAGDANTVAEYLDNTLPAERIADFEKICLESDSHLAEVAACHQILTLVLGEPADVDPTARERIYGVIDRADAPSSTPVVASAPPVGADTVRPPVMPAPAPAAAAASQRRARPEVPDYLRESRSRFWPLAAVLLIAALLTTGILAVVAPTEWRETASNWLQREPAEAPTAPATENGTDPSKAGAALLPPSETTDESKPAESTRSGDNDPAAPPAGVLEPPLTQPDLRPAPGPPVSFPKPAESPNDGDSPLAPLPPEPAGPMKGRPGDDVSTPRPASPDGLPELGPVPGRPELSRPEPGRPELGRPELGRPEAGRPDMERPIPGPAEPSLPIQPPPGATISPPPRGETGLPNETPSEGVGRYLSGDVLLRFDPASASWRRLPAKASLLASDRLLSLPTFRPSVTLVTGLSIQPIGAADFELTGVEQGVPGIALDYGRMAVVTIGRAGNQVRLQLGKHAGLVTFLDAESALAVDAHRTLIAGQNPETEPAIQVIDLYCTSGEIRWEENGQTTSIRAPNGRHLAPPPTTDLDGTEQPKWIITDNLTALDQRAASSLEHDIVLDRPAAYSLKELADSRRAEVRTLAVRCSGYVGEFEPFIAALNDADQRTEWPRHIEALRAALARSPQTATAVRQAFEKHRGAEAEDLYRMLWGYSAVDLKDGAATKLVEYLNHDSLDFRVLSFWNLQNITGLTLFYRPESPVAKRRPQYLKWKERLKDGKLMPPPAPVGRTTGPARPVKPEVE